VSELEGQVAFISGAARGQGRNHAVRLAREGVDIVAVDICRQMDTVPYPMASPADLAETARLVEGEGRKVVSMEVDVRDLSALETAASAGMEAFGRLDIVVANAGISSPAPTLHMSEADWDDMIDVNLTGVWKTVKATAPHVVAGGRGGSLVLISSLAAMAANPNTAHYSAAKAGLVALMQVLAKELAPQRIRVNTIHPTTVATDMVLNEATYRLFRPDLENPTRADFEKAALTLNRLPVAAVESDDITEALLYLVKSSGRYVTGTTHLVDAGGAL
jgi:SDR family mycofactocin-dependent oxidoreductase